MVTPPTSICPTIHRSTSKLYLSNNSRTTLPIFGRTLFCKIKTHFFQHIWSVRVYLAPQCLQKLTIICRSYSCTTRYPVCHDHTFTTVCVNRLLFHVLLGPLECFRSRGTFASPLTGMRFQFRLDKPDPGFVICNHLLQKFVPFFTKSVQQLL